MSPVNSRVQEPSMEEILASIRRIIADDQDRVPAPRFNSTPAPLPARPIADEPVRRDVRPVQAKKVEPDRSDLDPGGPEEDEVSGEGADLAEASPAPADVVAATPPVAAEAPPPPPETAPPPMAMRVAPATVETAPQPVEANPPREPEAPDSLVSRGAEAAVGQAFQRLSATAQPRSALTMEEHVTEMLRPMLKAWLDENLPPLVERLVQAEIERIARSR